MSLNKKKYIAFLGGINVGGKHKVPMAELKTELEKLDLHNIQTLLNSGNIIFEAKDQDAKSLEKIVADHIEQAFGFAIPTIIRKSETILDLLNSNPFKDVTITPDTRLYVSFLQEEVETNLQFPWSTSDNAFRILDKISSSISLEVKCDLTSRLE
ncbi:MAG: DUF1697 domain-containing protein [Leeuwenhoekiella sp.]